MTRYQEGDIVRWQGFEATVTRVRGISGVCEIEYRETSRSDLKTAVVHENELKPLAPLEIESVVFPCLTPEIIATWEEHETATHAETFSIKKQLETSERFDRLINALIREWKAKRP